MEPVPSATADFLCEGYLFKKSHVIHVWRRRYCRLLTDGSFLYWSNEQSTKKKPRAVLKVSRWHDWDGRLHHLPGSKAAKYPMAFASEKGTIILLFSLTLEDDIRWTSRLREVCNRLRPPPALQPMSDEATRVDNEEISLQDEEDPGDVEASGEGLEDALCSSIYHAKEDATRSLETQIELRERNPAFSREKRGCLHDREGEPGTTSSHFLLRLALLCGDLRSIGRLSQVCKSWHETLSLPHRRRQEIMRERILDVRTASEKERSDLFLLSSLWTWAAVYSPLPLSPPAFGYLWLSLCQSYYPTTKLNTFLSALRTPIEENMQRKIWTDVNRTYGVVAPHKRRDPSLSLPRYGLKEDSDLMVKKERLARVVSAMVVLFPQIGYCQGMDYIIAHFIANTCDETEQDNERQERDRRQDAETMETGETCFGGWIAGQEEKEAKAVQLEKEAKAVQLAFYLFEDLDMKSCFQPGLTRILELCFIFDKLCERQLPKLYSHFQSVGVFVEMFAVGWFQTLFLYIDAMSSHTINRLWTVLFLEGELTFVLRVGLAVLQLSEKSLLSRDIDGVMRYLNTMPSDSVVSEKHLLEAAYAIPLDCEYIEQCKAGFDAQRVKKENNSKGDREAVELPVDEQPPT